MAEKPYNPYASTRPPTRSAQLHAERLRTAEQTSGWLPLTKETIKLYVEGAVGEPEEDGPSAA
jgi:hypothetical protein